jgi:hypothetical protein
MKKRIPIVATIVLLILLAPLEISLTINIFRNVKEIYACLFYVPGKILFYQDSVRLFFASAFMALEGFSVIFVAVLVCLAPKWTSYLIERLEKK